MTSMTHDIDELARALEDLIAETASRQIAREIAHLAEIQVDSGGSDVLEAPVGYRAPASGFVTTHAVARSREIPTASVEVRVTVWIAEPGTDTPVLLVTRDDSDRTLRVEQADIDPEPSAGLRAQINDFVAVIIAHMVSGLNVAMQRSYLRGSDDDVAEYEGS